MPQSEHIVSAQHASKTRAVSPALHAGFEHVIEGMGAILAAGALASTHVTFAILADSSPYSISGQSSFAAWNSATVGNMDCDAAAGTSALGGEYFVDNVPLASFRSLCRHLRVW